MSLQLTSSERYTESLLARLDAIEAHPVMVRALAEARSRADLARVATAEPAWLAEGRELIERAG